LPLKENPDIFFNLVKLDIRVLLEKVLSLIILLKKLANIKLKIKN